jgi:peptide/nickel transport system permease protein
LKSISEKFLFSLTVLLGVYIILFILFQVLSINSAQSMIGQSSNKATEEAIAKEFHLDQPPMVRFLISLNEISPLSYFSEDETAVFCWDSTLYNGVKLFSINKGSFYLKYPYLGKSFQNQEHVTTLLAQRFFSTLVLAFCAIIFATILGVLLGILAAVKKNTWIDQSCLAFSAMGISAPSFFVAILIALLFGYYLSEWTGLSFKGSLIEMDDYGNRIYEWKNLILPVAALGLRPVAILTQITRNSMLDVLGEDYIRTAIAKGLSPRVVFFKHALLNALNPVITSVSGWFGSLLAGAYFIEVIFDYKGLGNLTVNALMKFDIPLVMGASLYIAFTFVLISFLVDFLYLMIDPRMRK